MRSTVLQAFLRRRPDERLGGHGRLFPAPVLCPSLLDGPAGSLLGKGDGVPRFPVSLLLDSSLLRLLSSFFRFPAGRRGFALRSVYVHGGV